MNFKRKRATNKLTGEKVRVLDVQVTQVESGEGIVVYCDDKNTLYLSMETTKFNDTFVEGWLSKEELGLGEDEVKKEPETLVEKLDDIIDDIKDKANEVLNDTKEIVDEIKESVSNIVGDIQEEVEETLDDIKEIVENDSEDKETKKSKSKK